MSQAAFWHVMNMFQIPDVDLLEQIYDSATDRLAPNDTESATSCREQEGANSFLCEEFGRKFWRQRVAFD